MAFGLWGCGDKANSATGGFGIEPTYIQESAEHLDIQVQLPVLSSFPGAEELNRIIKDKADALTAEVREAGTALEELESAAAAGLHSEYQYFRSGPIVSLWINWDNYTGGAHGLYWVDSYTFNTETGERYSFPGLFAEGKGGVEYVTREILEDIRDDGYFDTAADTINNYQGDYQFLINGDELIVYFPLYDITAYAAGIQSFDFDLEELSPYLKPEIADAMRGQESAAIPYLQID